MGRLSQLSAVRWACGIFVEFFRAVPVLMMMLFAYYVFLFGFQISGDFLSLFGVIAGLTFYNSSVIAELIRSGVGALPQGQREAGLAIGLTPFQTLRTVLLPQSITLMLPSIVSQMVVVLKDSALGFLILYEELVRAGQTLASARGNLIPTFIVVAAIFIVINYLLTLAGPLPGAAAAGVPTGTQGAADRPDAQPGHGARCRGDVAGGQSHRRSRASARGLRGPGLADDDDLDLAGVGQLLLDLLGDVAGQDLGLDVVDHLRGHHHPDLPAGLHREDLVHPSRARAISSSRSSRCT